MRNRKVNTESTCLVTWCIYLCWPSYLLGQIAWVERSHDQLTCSTLRISGYISFHCCRRRNLSMAFG